MSADPTPYEVSIATFALNEDGAPGPAGWGMVIARDGREAHYSQHCCHASHQTMREAAVARAQVILAGRKHFFSERHQDAAAKLAKHAAIVPHEPSKAVVR